MSQSIVTQSCFSFSVGVVDEIQFEDVVDPFWFFLFHIIFSWFQEIIFLFSSKHFRTFKDEVLLAFTEIYQFEPLYVDVRCAFKFDLPFVASFCVKNKESASILDH